MFHVQRAPKPVERCPDGIRLDSWTSGRRCLRGYAGRRSFSGEATSQAQCARGALNHLKIAGGMGFPDTYCPSVVSSGTNV